MTPCRLADLLRDVPNARLVSGDPLSAVRGIAFDSRAVQPGQVFVAIPGLKRDGREFVSEAVQRGASAVVAQAELPEQAGVASVQVPSARAALADLAAAFYGHPSRELTLVGITGTDGKTSTTQMLSAVLDAAGRRTSWLTTVDLKIGGERRTNDLRHTTPEAVGVQALLRESADAKVDVAILEVSSHALALERVRGCEFDLAIFTNLSPEHLNFHSSMAEYLETKSRLFRMLSGLRSKSGPVHGVINADDPASEAIRQACAAPLITFGIDDPADVMARNVSLTSNGSRFELHTPTAQVEVTSRLLGRFNVLNWLAAAAGAHALGVGPEETAQAAAALTPIRGRMEPIDRGQPFALLVDFAHTPKALETALRTLREHTRGRLLLVFGNAGERDPDNRYSMGRVAAQLADFFVISMDDPLHEDPAAIAAQAADGARQVGARQGLDFDVELDRRKAIQMVLERARPGDAVLLAGKGHEARMLVGNERLPWDDRAAAEELLQQAR